MCMMMHAMDHSAHDAPAAASGPAQTESLLDVLKRRYALGEISTAQFEEMKRTLGLNEGETTVELTHH